jgi:NHLM bacteriocin system ABC transporter ATP-binding protein
VVETGSVDVFLVRTQDGVPTGPRWHVFRVTPGEAMLGMGHSSSSLMQLVAVPVPDSRVLEITRAQLRLSSGSATDREEVARLLDQWIVNLSRAATGNARPGVSQRIASLPREGVVWVPLPTQGLALFPLSRFAWINAEQTPETAARRTTDCLGDDPMWVGLQAFHGLVVDRLHRHFLSADDVEQARLNRRGQSDGARMDAALRLLAAPLGPVDEHIAMADDAESDPLLLACRALERELGVRFRSHPDRRERVARRDPIDAIARASGVRVRTVALRGDWWKRDNGPLLGRRERDKAPVALLPVSARSYELWDPVARTRLPVDEIVAATLDPFASYFYRPFPGTSLSAMDVIRFGLKGCQGSLATILVMGIAAGLLGTMTPIITGVVFDSVIPGANRPQLLPLFVLMAVVSLCIFLFQAAQSFAMVRLEGKMDASVQAAVWDRLLSLPVPFFRDYSAGDLAVRGLSIGSMRQVLTGSVLSSVFAGLFSVFNLALLFYYSWRLALLATGLTLVTGLATVLGGYLQVRYQRVTTAAQGHLSGMLLQFINGLAKLRVSGAENRAFEAWAKEFTRQRHASIRARKVTLVLAMFTAAFPVVSAATIYIGMFVLVGRQAESPLSTGSFLAFNAAFAQFQFAVIMLSAAVVSALSVVPLYERAKPILDARPEVNPARRHPGELAGGITVEHVSFRYRPDGPLVLRDVSLRVPAGRFVAIVGASGSGKSTLLRMLLGFETPESGAIYVDNQDMSQLDIQAVRQQIGVVLQSGRLLSDSIHKNIVGSAPLTFEDAWEAARLAGLEDDIKAMPMGMHTIIGESGGGLSGGQRQRLMIARAIVRRPRILLFDEATSALDNETQAIVSRSLEGLQATRLVIAHRLSTVTKADRIYVMEKGAVVQEGSYDDLMQRDGPFADLARRQLT